MAFDPTTIANLYARFRADTITGVNSGSTFTTWNSDLGGFSTSQYGNSNPPKYVTAVLNGHAVARLDGTMGLAATASAGASAVQTLLAVVVPTSAALSGTSVIRGGNTPSLQLQLTNGQPSLSTGSGAFATSSATLVAAKLAVIIATYDANSGAWAFNVNGIAAGSGTSPQSLYDRSWFIGEDSNLANRFNGDIAEIAQWNRVLTATEITNLSGYGTAQYGAATAPAYTASPNLTGSGALAATGIKGTNTVAYTGTASLTGSGALAATGIKSTTTPAYTSAASLAGAGTLTSTATSTMTTPSASALAVSTGLTHRWRASSITGVANGGNVTSAPFDVGGLTLTSSGTRIPTFQANALNGRPGVLFDGSDDILAYSGTAAPVLNQPLTAIVVMAPTATAQSQIIATGGFELAMSLDGNTGYEVWGGSALANNGTPTTGGQVFTVALPGDGSNSMFKNGTSLGGGYAGTQGTTNNTFTIGNHPGASRPFKGSILEVIIYDHVLTANDRASVHAYVRDTYGIASVDAPLVTSWTGSVALNGRGLLTLGSVPAASSAYTSIFSKRPLSAPITWNGVNGGTISNKYFADIGNDVSGIYLANCSNIVIEQNDFETVSQGITLINCTNIEIRYNRFNNVTGPHDRNGAHRANILQADGCGVGLWFHHNEGSFSGDTEDLISIYNSNGTQANPIVVENNKLANYGYISYSGSGIMLGDGGGSWQIARNNVLDTPGQVGIGVAGGSNITVDNNQVYSPSLPTSNVGIYAYSANDGGQGISNITITNNRVNWKNSSGTPNGFYSTGITGTFTNSGNNFNDSTLAAPKLLLTTASNGTANIAVGYTTAAALSGSGALTVSGKPAYAFTTTLAGAGALAATTVPRGAANAILGGTGALTATGVTTQAASTAANLAGAGALIAGGAPVAVSNVSLSGVGGLSVNVNTAISRTTILSGTGTLAAGTQTFAATAASFSGAGALTVTTIATPRASAALSGTGTLTSTGIALSGASAIAAFSGNGALSAASANMSVTKTVALAGAGVLSAGTRVTGGAVANLSGSGALSATTVARIVRVGTADLIGSGTLTTTAIRGYSDSVDLHGIGSLIVTGKFVEAPTPPPISLPLPAQPVRVNASNLTGYTVEEDATPLDASSTEGGVGTISFALPADEKSILLFDSDIELDDAFRGTTSGTVTKVGISNGLNSVAADSRLGVLVGNAKAKPVTGTFESVARYYLSIGAIVNDVYFDPAISDISVSAQGWEDDAWLKLKQLCAANGVEVALVGTQIVFRAVRSLTTSIHHRTDFEVDLEKSDIAKAVEITYYDNFWVNGEVIYPRTSEEQGAAQVYQVEAGQILEDDITLTASVESVLQPVCVDDVAQDYDGSQSVYSVRAVDNTVVTPQNWAAGGGKIELSIGADTKTIHIKITGSSDQYHGPYRIAGRMKETIGNVNNTIIPPGSTDNPATAPVKEAAKAAATKTTSTTTSITYPKAKNDYPWPNAPVNGLSPLRYSYRDCVDFVAWRINRDAGVTKAPWKYTWANLRKTNGNAIGWKHDWELAGRATGITPVPGAIAWFGSSAGAYGHVAYVQSVDTTNKTVHLEEYNWGANQAYHTRTIKWSSVDSFLASPAGSTKTIIQNTTVKDAKADAAKAAAEADAEANKASANPAESEKDYASLRIVGTGVLIDPQILTLPTGAAANRTASDVGVTVENIYVSSLEDAYDVGIYVASRYKGESHTISGTLTLINQTGGGPGDVIYRKIEEFNRVYDGKTIADFNAEWAGKTIADFDRAQQTDTIETFFDNQVFGNVAGARFKHDNAMWRIANTTINESSIVFSAIRDTMIQDFNEAHAGKSIADFNAQYAGMTMKQFGRTPLLGG